MEFLESFACVVGSMWPSLATSLSLSDEEIEEVKNDSSPQCSALRMLQKWCLDENSTYGQLYQALKTMLLFQELTGLFMA